MNEYDSEPRPKPRPPFQIVASKGFLKALRELLAGGPSGPGSGKCSTCEERMDCNLFAVWSARRN